MQQLLLKPKDCQEVLNLKNTKFYEEVITDPTFPKPVNIGKSKYWRLEDIKEWVRGLQASA